MTRSAERFEKLPVAAQILRRLGITGSLNPEPGECVVWPDDVRQIREALPEFAPLSDLEVEWAWSHWSDEYHYAGWLDVPPYLERFTRWVRACLAGRTPEQALTDALWYQGRK